MCPDDCESNAIRMPEIVLRGTVHLQMLRSRTEARAGAGEFCDSRAMHDVSKSLP